MFSASRCITFTDIIGVDAAYAPTPATQNLPEWYKRMDNYVTGRRIIVDGVTPHTVKKCVPVFDAMTAGYILRTYVDVQVTQRNGAPWYEWPSNDAISFHPVEQALNHPAMNGAAVPKWTNPWAISTPQGYSTLFVPPLHNPNGIFTVLPGIVDTDAYQSPVNFPFTLNDLAWEGLIPAGTPMIQVIPFKREDWNSRMGNEKNRARQRVVSNRLRSLWWNSYKKQFWSRKQFR